MKETNFPELLRTITESLKRESLGMFDEAVLLGFARFSEWAFWSAVTTVEANVWEESALEYLGSIAGEGRTCGTFGVGDLDEHFLEMAWRSAEVCVRLRKAIGVIS